jgi:hypothetical protein
MMHGRVAPAIKPKTRLAVGSAGHAPRPRHLRRRPFAAWMMKRRQCRCHVVLNGFRVTMGVHHGAVSLPSSQSPFRICPARLPPGAGDCMGISNPIESQRQLRRRPAEPATGSRFPTQSPSLPLPARGSTCAGRVPAKASPVINDTNLGIQNSSPAACGNSPPHLGIPRGKEKNSLRRRFVRGKTAGVYIGSATVDVRATGETSTPAAAPPGSSGETGPRHAPLRLGAV